MPLAPEEQVGASPTAAEVTASDRGGVARRWIVGGLVGWAGLVGGAILWGVSLRARSDLGVDAPPFYGRYRDRYYGRFNGRIFGHFEAMLTDRLIVPIIVGAVLVIVAPIGFRRIPWRSIPVAAGGLSVTWGLVLQRIDGTALAEPLTTKYDYLAGVHDIGSPLTYLRHFTEHLHQYPTHVKAHPPGLVLLLWVLDRCGLSGATPLLVLVLVAWAVAVGAVLVTLRAVAGEAAARRAALPVVLAPALIWVVTASDAIFAGVTAAAIALVTVALVQDRSQANRADRLSLAGGVLFGLALLLTYGAVPLLAVPGVVALRVRQLRPLLVAACGGVVVLGLAAAAGFWWFAGLAATRAEYDVGISRIRPYGYFLIGNLAVFAVICGPAVAAGIASMRRRTLDASLLCAGALVAVLATDLSGLSKGEVERIWLLFVPWVVSGVAAATPSSAPMRLLILAQVACAIAVPVLLRTPN
jgi:hypothetical protein